jgi:hypothetical protein
VLKRAVHAFNRFYFVTSAAQALRQQHHGLQEETAHVAP